MEAVREEEEESRRGEERRGEERRGDEKMKTEEEVMNRLRQLQKEEHEMSDKQFLHDGYELQARERELERVLELSEEEVRKMWLVVLT